MGNEITDNSYLKREPSKTRGRGLSFFFLRMLSFRVRVMLGLGLESTLNLTLKQHSLNEKIDSDPAWLTPQLDRLKMVCLSGS